MKQTGSVQSRGGKKEPPRSQNSQQQQIWPSQMSNASAEEMHFMKGSHGSSQIGPFSSTPSTPRQQQYPPCDQTRPHPDLKRILHLYLHDYCLKQNYIKAANSIAADTGVRTDEGVPIGKEAPGGLLLQWFSQFWEIFADTNSSLETSSNKGVTSLQSGQQHSSHLPSFMTSATMRRTETEPTRGSSFVNEMRGNTSMHSPEKSNAMGSHGATATTAAQSWGCPADNDFNESPRLNHAPSVALSQSAQDDTSMLIQKMGWGDQKYEDLDVKDRNQLIDVLKRSQMAQQQALERMAHVYRESVEPSVHRSFNGTAFQQMPSSLSLSPPQIGYEPFSASQPSPGLNIAFQHQQNAPDSTGTINTAKKPKGAGPGRKKRRSSVNAQNATPFQLPIHQQQSAASSNHNSLSRNNSSGPPQLAPSPNISGVLPSVLQPENNAIYDHRPSFIVDQSQNQSQNQNQGNKQRAKGVLNSPTRGNTSYNAHQAQNEATSQASSQINAQISQLQNQLKSKGNAQSNSSQISQLKMLQEKLNHSAKSAEIDWSKQHQHPTFMARPMMSGDMGPPPSPGIQPMQSYMQQQIPFGMDNPSHMPAPATPALTTSSTISNSTPEWRDNSNRMMQDSPGGMNMQGVSNQISQSLAAFGASIDSSHLNSGMVMGAPPPPHHEQQQQKPHYFPGSNAYQGYYQQHHLLKSPMETSTEGSDFVNLDWNNMGSI